MNSSDLSRIRKEFESWHQFDKKNVETAPQEKGVYIIRQALGKPFGRLRGESEILYIGSSKAEKGLRQRLLHYFHPGPTQWTNRRINELLKRYSMEISWCTFDEPTNLEHDLLRQYLNDHDELPPFNHADIRRLYKSITEHIGLSDSVTVIKTKG